MCSNNAATLRFLLFPLLWIIFINLNCAQSGYNLTANLLEVIGSPM